MKHEDPWQLPKEFRICHGCGRKPYLKKEFGGCTCDKGEAHTDLVEQDNTED